MASLPNITPDKRKTTVLVTLISLLALFMVPYFFVFIPSNADNLKSQAFLKLNRAARNIISKTTDTRNYYLNTKTETETLHSGEMHNAECFSDGRERISLLDSIYFKYAGTDGWNIIFTGRWDTTRTDSTTQAHIQSLESFAGPCLASGKEVFSSFLLLHYCQFIGRDSSGKIIFQNFREGMEQNINLDSLVPRHKGMRTPDVQDISLEGTDYKLFSYPFQLGRHRLILCGLLKTESYNSQIHKIPVEVFYFLIICLTLFLLCLPFLKIFMMNERDRIYTSNLINGVVFLFIMSSFITIIITQLVLLWQGRSQINKNLESLSVKIEDSLVSELRLAQSELVFFDSRLNNFLQYDENEAVNKSSGVAPFYIMTKDPGDHNQKFDSKQRVMSGHTPLYHNYDHCSWVNEAGQECVRINYIDSAMAINLHAKPNVDSIKFVNVKSRPYYQEMSRNWKFKKDNGSKLMLAPVHSWASGEFRVNICRYSQYGVYMLELMETRLYSLVNTVLPTGYGYCLFDETGNVLIHSDSLKSLRENFLDETLNLPWINGAIKGRQDIQAANVSFYGEAHTLRIQPLKQHPLFLAVFYDNDFIEPPILRILTFTVFFCLLTYGLLILLFKVFYNPHPQTCLYSPMDYYGRMIPLKEKIPIYFNGSLFLFIYIPLFIAAAILGPLIRNDFDFTMLVFGLLSPFTILYALWLLYYKSGSSGFKKSILLIVPFLLTGTIINLLSHLVHWPLEPYSFWTMEALLGILLYVIVMHKGDRWSHFRNRIRVSVKKMLGWEKKTAEQKKLISYSCFFTLFIFAIAVLPSLEYSWFAYNHELRQSIKKEQLEIAGGLQKREKTIISFLKNHQPDFSGKNQYFDTIQYKKGIYPVYKDSISYLPEGILNRKEKVNYSNSEPFYLSIANTINSYYSDTADLPPLYNSTKGDNLWHWNLTKDTSEFDYAKPRWAIPAPGDSVFPKASFKIFSPIPAGFHLDNQLEYVFAGMLLILAGAVYQITKSISRQVCLTKIVTNAGTAMTSPYGNDKSEFWEKCFEANADQPGIRGKWTSASELINALTAEYSEFSNTAASDTVSKESEIISRSVELRPLFECAWKTLDDKEKYLCYCLANDGLINHKNESLIYSLQHKKLLIIYNQRIQLLSYSFRDFIISRNNTPDEKSLLAKMQAEASWNYMRTILLIVVMSVFIFLFLTQQKVSSQIIALVTSLSALIPLIFKSGISSSASADKT